MKVTPMLMTSGNVRKILDGCKTQTRRVADTGLYAIDERFHGHEIADKEKGRMIRAACPYGAPGDILALKETFYAWGYWHDDNLGKPGKQKWRWVDETSHGDPIITESERIFTLPKIARDNLGYHKRPSLYLPKTEWRVFLRIDEVRVERLQDISEADAVAEGCDAADFSNTEESMKPLIDYPLMDDHRPYANSYSLLWDSINAKPLSEREKRLREWGDGKPDISWAANPWVWAITFTPIPRLTLTPDGKWIA